MVNKYTYIQSLFNTPAILILLYESDQIETNGTFPPRKLYIKIREQNKIKLPYLSLRISVLVFLSICDADFFAHKIRWIGLFRGDLWEVVVRVQL